MTTKETHSFSPQWFLKALGNGGLAVSFFMYLMFMIAHQTPIPTFTDVYRELSKLNLASLAVAIDLVIILYFAIRFFKELYIQTQRYFIFKKSAHYKTLKGSNNEVSLMNIPLTYAMAINVLFTLGAVFVPNLWSVVEYLFPFALLGFVIVGASAIKIYLHYFKETIADGNFMYVENNNFSQMTAPFTFVMVAVGLAAPAAMSHTLATNIVGMILSIFFLILTFLLININLVLGFKSIGRYGVHHETVPTLWIMIPIMTLVGITIVRLTSGVFHHIVKAPINPAIFMILITILVSIQVVFGLFGYSVMKKHNYFDHYVTGNKFSIGSYALICPGVAFTVLGMFYVAYGFVKTSFVTAFSPMHLLLILPFAIVQLVTVITIHKLDKKAPSPMVIM
ncbi:MAG: hypothetical protein JXO44_13955 [Clostridia bacterium]|nr:hypothetical protein [Clostridia bacterium]